jgi:rod shape-determining protein MreC
MEFLNRYRNLSVLMAAILAQLMLLAYQVRSNQNVRLISVWAVSVMTPVARALEAGREGTSVFFRNYFLLVGVREESRKMKAELDQAEMENQYLRAQLASADNAKALSIFQTTSRSKTLAAHNLGRTTDTSSQVIYVDRGSSDGVQKGDAVRTPEGLVGKIINVFPKTSDVLLITDPSFAAYVVSQKHHVYGTLKGRGDGTVIVDHVENEQTVDVGEMFLASGEDLIFPRGTPAGQVAVVRDGRSHKEIYLTPTGLQNGLDDVLIILDGVHGTIPPEAAPDEPVHLLQPPAPDDSAAASDLPAQSGAHMTELDRVTEKYRSIGEAQHHVFGDKSTPAPNYNLALPSGSPPNASSGNQPHAGAVSPNAASGAPPASSPKP